ncbi:MAG: ABC transporter substrate-binding protein [Actinobacteria bacterium]|nr:ABC transporter substrate-binding protein [Actinomycetota bacterium]
MLAANDAYWGGKPKLDRVIFRPISDGTARRQALESGEVQGYQPVDPADLGPLASAGFQLLRRQPINVVFLGLNQAKPPLDSLKIRQAVAHALNRDVVVGAKYPSGTERAKEFLPPGLLGYADDVTTYPFDPGRARALIAESGVANPTLEFWYPTGISNAELPDPEGVFEAFRGDLERVGFTVVAKPEPFRPGYSGKVLGGTAQMYLISGTGDIDPDSFLNLFFGQKAPPFGFDNPELFALVKQGDLEVDRGKREAIYQRINRMVMDILPGVPLAHVRPVVALSKRVHGYVPAPVSPTERLTKVSLD